MKKLTLCTLLASLAFSASAAADLSDFMELEFGKDYQITAMEPFKGKITAPENGGIVMYGGVTVYVLDNQNELRMLTDEECVYAGYINSRQAYQFSCAKDQTFYLWESFPIMNSTVRLEMNRGIAVSEVFPAENSVYDYAGNPQIGVTFNQNVSIGKAVLSCGEHVAEVGTRANGANVSILVNDALGPWYASDLINAGDDLTVTLSEVSDAFGNAAADIVLKFKACGKAYKMVSAKLPAVIKSYMPVSSDDTKAVFTFDGPIGVFPAGQYSPEKNPNIKLGYGPVDIGYEYNEALEAVVEGNTITVDLAGKLRTTRLMSTRYTSPCASMAICLYTIRDARGQLVDSENSTLIGTFYFEVPFEEIPPVDLSCAFTPASGQNLEGTDVVKIFITNANKMDFTGVKFTSGAESVVVAKENITVSKDTESDWEFTVPVPKGWSAKANIVVTLDGITTEDGYDHANDVRAKYNGFAITYSDPADGASVEKLLKGRTITVDSNLGEGAELSFSVVDSEGKTIYGPAKMEASSAGNYVHTMERTITLYRGQHYTLLFSIADGKSESLTLQGTGAEYEYNGWSLIEITPADKSEIQPNAVVTVKFDGLVAIEKVDGSVDFTAVPVGDNTDNDSFDNAWALTLAATEPGTVDLLFAAKDQSNVPAMGNEGEEAESHYHFTFNISQNGIVSIESAGAAEGIYDLQGRRLSVPVKGINIINGRKVLVK